jgi:hypothetical protein
MRKLKKLVLMTAALAVLAVGGAAFAQAQSAGTVAKVTVQQGAGAESQTEAPDSASESDGPDGHHDESAGAGAAHESEGD